MYQLFDYQQKLVDGARKALAEGNKGVLIVSPPGSGKSIVIAEIARLATKNGKQILFTVNRKELVSQIKNSFVKQGVDLSNCTIMTVGKVANRLEKIPKPDLIIIDEAHHTRAKSYEKIINYFKDVPLLGFTATPWRMDGKGFNDLYSSLVEGPQVEWLIEHNRLADYTYVSRILGKKDLLKVSSTSDYTNRSMNQYIKSMNFGNVIKTYEEFAKDRKTIVYAPSIESAKLIVRKFKENGFNAVKVDSKTHKTEREEILNNFKIGKTKIIVNVDLISEGFDVPDCSCVIMLRPTKSLVFYLQQAMRCMRYQPHKKAIIIDHVGNFKSEEKVKVKYFGINNEIKTKVKKYPFGFPRDKRNWTIYGRTKPTLSNSNKGPAITTCDYCYAVIPANSVVCPICGEKLLKKKEIISRFNLDDDTEMKVLDSPDKHSDLFKTTYILTQDPSTFTTFKQYSEYGKARGYKPGWAYYHAKAKGLIR
ncbi:MAG: DEAD/DEAH box helicase [Lactobacillus johnsonii]|nr:DEAD/DEAH box helicase [Lactobacillus johnsonii]MDY5351673.1 DEAD/DEAH box helicase [Lactobacillus johnsonii]MDY5419648.1 DEAD/DEAH box helicase [Lactobacillus johnsonii]